MTASQIIELTPAAIARLPSKSIPDLVQAAHELQRTIKACQAVLDLLKARLVEEGRAEARKLNFAVPGRSDEYGTSWTFNSPVLSESAQVLFPEDAMIKGGFIFVRGLAHRWLWKERTLVPLGDIKALAGKFFEQLFTPSYKPAEAFRALAPALLPLPDAKKLLEMVQEPSAPRVIIK